MRGQQAGCSGGRQEPGNWRRGVMAWVAGLSLGLLPGLAWGDDFLKGAIDRLRSSDIEFQRSGSNAPYTPLVYVGARRYGDARLVNAEGERVLDFEQSTLSASAVLPLYVGQRDAVLGGAWLSQSRFSADNPQVRDFTVDSVGLPLGWLRQVQPRWQVAAFAMPLGHRSSQANSDWSLQLMGGAFARYIQSDTLWWAFGVFADHAPDERYALPYVGAAWIINRRWTLSAIMPWPAITYAPNRDWLFRLGASPSGASWTVSPNSDDIAVNLATWNFGLTAERHIKGPFWGAFEAGVGGLRGLRFDGRSKEIETPDISVGSSGYVALSLRLRVR